MALSAPLASSTTTAATLPPVAATTTAYCVSSVSVGTVRGSTRTPEPGVSGTVCVVTRVPSEKRYQLSVALVAVADWRRIGVVQPVAPPSVRVTLGRKCLGEARPGAVEPMPLEGPRTLLAPATLRPPARDS